MSEIQPEKWLITTIDEVTTNTAQRQPQQDENFIYIDIGSIDREQKIISNPEEILGKNAPSRARKVVQTGDVLVSTTRPNLNAVAMVPEKFNNQIASTGFDVLRAHNVDPRWLFYIVRTTDFVQAMSELVQGALYPAIRSKDIRFFEIPLAPLNEQKRIADKLDRLLAKVDACRERCDRIPLILKRFRQSVLAAATSGELTEDWQDGSLCSWTVQNVQDVSETVFDGPFGSNLKTVDYTHSGVRVIRLENIANLRFIGEKKTYISDEKYLSLQKHTLKPNDILFSSFVDEEVRVCLFPLGEEVSINKADCLCARVKPDVCLAKFLSFRLACNSTYTVLKDLVHGATRPRINLSQLRQFEFDLPPLAEQQEIVRRVEKLFAFADRLESRYQTARAKCDRLTPALLEKAFQGELVPQDPNDEPASVLLERIKSLRTNPEAKQTKPQRRKTAPSR